MTSRNRTIKEVTTEWEDPHGWRVRVMNARDMQGDVHRYISVGNCEFYDPIEAHQFTDQIAKAVEVLNGPTSSGKGT